MCKLILIRHGESEANTQGIYQGQTYDTNLTALGKKQAQAAAEKVQQLPVARVFTSPLKRTFQTAQIIAREIRVPVIQDIRLLEIDHGDWGGQTKEKVAEMYPNLVKKWVQNPTQVVMPRGENLAEVQKRVMSLVAQWRREGRDRSLAVVSHDVTLRVLISHVLGLPLNAIWNFRLDNGALTTINLAGKPGLSTLNDNGHLAGVQSPLETQAL